MDVIGHATDIQKLAALLAYEAAHVFVKLTAPLVADHGTTVLGAADHVIEQVCVGVRHDEDLVALEENNVGPPGL
jgi:hypothetical protein